MTSEASAIRANSSELKRRLPFRAFDNFVASSPTVAPKASWVRPD